MFMVTFVRLLLNTSTAEADGNFVTFRRILSESWSQGITRVCRAHFVQASSQNAEIFVIKHMRVSSFLNMVENGTLILLSWLVYWRTGRTSPASKPWSCWTTVFPTRRSVRSQSDASGSSGTHMMRFLFCFYFTQHISISVITYGPSSLHTVTMNCYST